MVRQDADKVTAESLEEEETKLLESLGLLNLVQESETDSRNDDDTKTNALHDALSSSKSIESGDESLWDSTLFPSSMIPSNKVLLGVGGTLFLLPHLAIILSLPPVLQRRGAPYLPTFANKLNVMFDLMKRHITSNKSSIDASSLKFVDLGSGDGRVVFRAARSGMFQKSVGYEINPALHMWVKFRQLVTPKYWSSTEFHLGDLWKIKLHRFDVVAVYGLYPIMDRLGKKLQAELKPGSIVLSNVFEIPGWRASTSEGSLGKGVYLYRVPECYRYTKAAKMPAQDVKNEKIK